MIERGAKVLALCGMGAALASCSRGYTPGLGEIMGLQQMRHAKLWLAGQAENWDLAGYELDELEEGFADVVKLHPTHGDEALPLADLVPTIMGQPLRSMRGAIAAHDPAVFRETFERLTAGCNSCHQATHFGFNLVRRPPDAGWFANQDFASVHRTGDAAEGAARSALHETGEGR